MIKLNILFIVLLLIVLFLSGLACHPLPDKNNACDVSSPSPSGSRDSSRPDAVEEPLQVQVRLNGLTLGMSLDSAITSQREKDFSPTKPKPQPAGLQYDFVPNDTELAAHDPSGPSIVVDKNNRVVEVDVDYGYPPDIEIIGIDGKSGKLEWGDSSKKIIAILGKPQQKKDIGDKRESWFFPRLGLVLTVLGPDHFLFAARLRKIE